MFSPSSIHTQNNQSKPSEPHMFPLQAVIIDVQINVPVNISEETVLNAGIKVQ